MTTLIVLGLAIAVGLLVVPTGVIVNTGLLNKNARSEFFNRFDATPAVYRDLCTELTSTKDQENYRWLGSVPQMREFIGGRQAKGLRPESYDVVNKTYEATLEVDVNEVADDQTGQINIRIQELGQRAATHPDYLIADLLVHGATAGYLSYDGVTFFNDAHISGASGSQDNDLTATAAAAVKTTAECQTALKAAIGAMLAYLDDQGEPMVMDTSGLVVVCPPSMYLAMQEAVNQGIVLAATSAIGSVLQGIARVVSLPWLTVGTTFYLCKTNGIIRPFIFQDRERIEFAAINQPDSEHVFTKNKMLFGVKARYAVAYAYWQYCVRTVFNN